MKRSKIFLGLTTCLLGIAALAAAKIKFNLIKPYYKTPLGCPEDDIAREATRTPSGDQLYTAKFGFSYGLYETRRCIVPLYSGE